MSCCGSGGGGRSLSLFYEESARVLDFTFISFSLSVYELQRFTEVDGYKMAVQNLWGRGVIQRDRSLLAPYREMLTSALWSSELGPFQLSKLLHPPPPFPFSFLAMCISVHYHFLEGMGSREGFTNISIHLSPETVKVLSRPCCAPISRVGRRQTHLQGVVCYVWSRPNFQPDWADLELAFGLR